MARTTQRRFVVLRQRVREGKSTVGRVLLDVSGYTYRIFVTNRSESTEIIWGDYNGRACIIQRIGGTQKRSVGHRLLLA